MRRAVALLGLGVVACSSAGGPSELRAPRRVLYGGAAPSRGLLVARMEEEITTSEHKPGRRFRALLAAPFTDEEGAIRLAPGARIVGRVTESSRGHGAKPGAIALAIDEIIVSPTERYRVAAPVVSLDVQQGAPELSRRAVRGGYLGGILVGTLFGAGWGGGAVLLGAGLGGAGGVVESAEQRVVDARVDAKSFVTAHVHAITRE